MELIWILLILCSAATHPLRDLSLKGVANPLGCYIGVMITWLVLSAMQTLLTDQSLTLPAASWKFVFISGIGLILYYYGTLSAMKKGNLSVYYPIIRSSPLAIILFSWLLLGQSYTQITLIGIGVVLFGSFMIQKSSGTIFHDIRSLILALIAMIGSAAYTLGDAFAMQIVTPGPYIFYCYSFGMLTLLLIYFVENRDQPRPIMTIIHSWRHAPIRIIFAGVTSYLSYQFILYAFQLGAEAAAVSAVRQASIPVSVVLAHFLLKEMDFKRRIGWACVIALGIILISLA